ncbi:DUF488 family protein [Niabella sp.]|uniref:DUF488 domain-containing protein n=1 Tax=Niabella sp. TaxID=1962976 RepID=UPI00263086F3|nr:DUF488 domain-containing protein [Niabella sp.]
MQALHTLYTIGHSTHSSEDFIHMLQSFNIRMLADIRRFPGSKKFPRFNSEELAAELKSNGIGYVHLEVLGGRRNVQEHSRNHRWRNASFRGYADYMETPEFTKGIKQLEALAVKQPTACMCSEAVWWRCHRSLVADYLKAKGWQVLHIMGIGKAEEHPYTSPARVAGDQVFYFDAGLFDQ